jgi:hypothetical protein
MKAGEGERESADCAARLGLGFEDFDCESGLGETDGGG